jgi:two-component system, NarL family, sensor kinase
MLWRRSLSLGKSPILWTVAGLFGAIAILELLTPPDYVMGYLYIVPILIAQPYLDRIATLSICGLGAVLTLLNIWIPERETIYTSMVINRLIDVVAIFTTGILSDRHRQSQQALDRERVKSQVRSQLANVREDFTSTLAHDLKTPILGAIETLKAFASGQFGAIVSPQKNVLEIVIRSHQNSLKLVETLLDIYRNDLDGLHLNCQPIDLGSIAEATTTELLDLASSRRVRISLRYSDSDFRQYVWVNGDAFQLQRVFANLIANAIDHSPRGAIVEVVLSNRSGDRVVEIMDAGVGMQPEEIPHLFERFYQGQSDRQASGSGLGLYLARQIVAAHGGKIWAKNRTPQGAIFVFSLKGISG